MEGFNKTMKEVLSDADYVYPGNWSRNEIEFSIKTAIQEKKLLTLVDWNELKGDDMTAEQFNRQFAIWLCVFDEIEEIEEWEKQLFKSVELSQKWFEKVESIEYIISNTDFKALYLLKTKGEIDRLNQKYDEILSFQQKNKISTNKLELFYKHLTSE